VRASGTCPSGRLNGGGEAGGDGGVRGDEEVARALT
jgi:hypothetical protein